MTNTTQQTLNSPMDSFAALFEATNAARNDIREGEIVNGTVLRVSKDNIVVDIGYKSEGVIPVSEFTGAGGEISVQPGDKVDVLVESREDDNGLVLLSKEKADKMKVWDEISAACERDEIIEGTISARVKGGLSVTIKGGVKAFLPGSQVDLRPIRNLDRLIGQTLEFKVIKFNKAGRRLYTWFWNAEGKDRFREMHTIIVDADGNLYGADNQLGRTQKFVPKKGADPKLLLKLTR